MSKNVKQVIVVRKDLNMRKGKMVAQGSHASMLNLLYKFRPLRQSHMSLCHWLLLSAVLCLLAAFAPHSVAVFMILVSAFIQCLNVISVDKNVQLNDAEKLWYYGNFRKICVYVESEAELMNILHDAKEKGLSAHLIEDAGLTEFNGVKTKTCVAIGPHFDEEIDAVTGKLPLL